MYENSVSGEVRRVFVQDGALLIQAGGRDWPMTAVGAAEFRVAGVTVLFRFEDGPAVRLRQVLEGDTTFFHPIEAASPGVAELRDPVPSPSAVSGCPTGSAAARPSLQAAPSSR